MKIPIVETLDIVDANPESRLVGMTPNQLKERGFPVPAGGVEVFALLA